jgi:phospholipid/cholesterol/gamma-HCH transport system substrate-binding protein
MQTTSHQKEFWVGLLVILVIALMLVFGWLMGVVGPFQKTIKLDVLYAFAGGVEVGSPVRVSGVKAGKVDKIDFLSEEESKKYQGATVRLAIDISERAAQSIRQDSSFYINMAGIIGERYIEVSPGGATAPRIAAGTVLRGIDPPRIDQLLSQGYGVFGKVQEFMERNEKTMTDFLNQMTGLMQDMNQILKGKERVKFIKLLEKLTDVTSDVHEFTTKMKEEKTQRAIDEIYEIIHRGHQIDGPALKKFLQEDGIRARIF